MYKSIRRIHFVGIGGIGMSGIAEILLNLGYDVTGSDLNRTTVTRRLVRRGAKIRCGHDSEHVGKAQVVVTSSAIARSNSEVRAAHAQGIPVIARAEMLAELMRLKYGIAVAGTHGKTTTTSLIAAITTTGKLDPTVVIGGRVRSLRSNARLGRGDFLVAEADESDGSFLHLHPTIAVVTNIDPEHLDHYRNYEELKKTFARFCQQIPFYGAAIFCIDHPASAQLAKDFSRRFWTYGLKRSADFTAEDIRFSGSRMTFRVLFQKKPLGTIQLQLLGNHNVANALAAIAVAHELSIPFSVTRRALKNFKGIGRRLEILSESDSRVIIDDYAHHPAEIRATLEALRKGWKGYRIRVVFQPHRYSRTKELFKEFTQCFDGCEELIVTPIYAASEAPIVGISGERLAAKVRGPKKVLYREQSTDIIDLLSKQKFKKEILISLGAGNVGQITQELARRANKNRNG